MLKTTFSNQPPHGHEFARNWVAGAADTPSLRRRLMAVLRLSCLSLGMSRKHLGLGALGAGAAVAMSALAMGAPAYANTIPTPIGCVTGAGGTVGRITTGGTSAQATDGSGTYSLVAGCEAKGNDLLGVTGYGAFVDLTGVGATGIGFNADAAKWATALGLETRATGTGSTALGFGSLASAANAVAIGGAGGNGTTPLSEANSTRATGDGAIAIGANDIRGAQAAAADSIALGGESTVATEADAGIAIGARSSVEGEDGVAIGNGSRSGEDGYNVAIGSGGTSANANIPAPGAAPEGAVAIGHGQTAQGNGAVALGTNNSANGNGSVAIGRQNEATGPGSLAFGDSSRATADRAIALGTTSDATADGAVAIGNSSKALDNRAVAIGATAQATSNSAVAIGNGAVAEDAFAATAIGYLANANAANAMAFGTESSASGSDAVAVGSRAHANGDGVTSVGHGAGNGAQGSRGVYVGSGAGKDSNGDGNSFFGDSAGATIQGGFNTAIGTAAGAGSTGSQNTSTGLYAGALGSGDRNVSNGSAAGLGIIGDNNVTIGSGSATGYTMDHVTQQVFDRDGNLITNLATIPVELNDVVSIGDKSYVTTDGAVALGAETEVTAENSVALGAGSVADGGSLANMAFSPTGDIADIVGTAPAGEVSIGSAGSERRITNVAAGSAETDAVNVSQLTALADVVEENETHYFSVNDGGVAGGNYNNDGATGTNAVAAGVNASATGTNNVAMGSNARSGNTFSPNSTQNAVAIGVNSGAYGTGAVALGSSALSNGPSVAIGQSARTVASFAASNFNNSSVAIGNGAEAIIDARFAAISSVAIGAATRANVANGTSIGNQASTTVAGGVALGSQSIANTAAGAVGYDPVTGLASADTSSTWVSTNGAISVGGNGRTRQITNVAAGTADTDAVNVAQLKQVGETANAGWNISAGGANETNVAPDGSVDFSNADGNIVVSKTADSNDVNFDLADDLAIGNSITVGDTVINGDSITTTNLNVGDNFYVDASGAHYGGPVTDETHIVNKSYVDNSVAELSDTPLTFAGNTGSAARKLGETVNIVGGGATIGAYSGANLRTEVDADGALQLLMAEAPRFGDVVINVEGSGRITGVAAGVDDADAVNLAQLKAVETGVEELGDRAVTYDGATGDPKGLITLAGDPSSDGGATGGTRITNLSQGAIDSLSTDAVNGAQLWGTANSIAAHLGGGAYGVTVNTDGTLTAPAYQIAAIGSDGSVTTTTHDNVGDALGGLSESVTNVNTQISNLGDQIGGLQNDALLWDDAKGAYSANHDGTGPNQITDVAAGELSETSTDAVNGSQLHATNQRVDQIDTRLTTVEGDITTIKSDVTNLDNRVTNIEEGVAAVTDRAVVYDGSVGAAKDHITLAGQTSTDGGVTGGTTISNLSQGELSATSTDAVNGAQLHATNQAIGTLSDNAVQYSLDANGKKTNAVALLGGDPNAPVLISNVAAGVAETDAVNVGQLNEGLRLTLNESKSYTDTVAINTLNQANEYTDLRFGELNRDISEVRDEARAAAALGLAAGSLRYDDRPGKVSVAVGVGSWRDKGALAWGVGYTSENQGVRANVSASMADGSVGVGAGFSLTLN